MARNVLVTEALKTDCTHILWVDDDIVLENMADGVPDPKDATKRLAVTNPNIALKTLLDLNLPIVAGLYRAKQREGFNYAAWMKVNQPSARGYGYVPIQNWSGNLFKVDVTGLGFCLVRREVFEKTQIERPGKLPIWFQWDSPDEVSEDFAWMERCKEKGFDTTIYADIKLSHLGTLAVQFDGTFRVPMI